ncbi:MAG: hypothetical protein H6707_05250 [Deltaproteobacteria bacterium]|nr:hypothetical protein [Deltaproteobacteria bacterium]
MRRTAAAFAVALICSLAVSCANKDERAAHQTLAKWLQANVDHDFVEVVALTADATFARIVKAWGAPVAEIRQNMPQLLAKSPHKLLAFTVKGEGKRIDPATYRFVVEEKTDRMGKRSVRNETIFVVKEGNLWRVDPEKTASVAEKK